jgi:hypothetical protein
MDNNQEKVVSESVKLITNALNKACLAGVYSLQEAYAIQIALNVINKELKSS